ncbi:MAG: tRNA (guanosine(46)-N7)-methyltransferase TrmB [Caulobacteraceae bacterium]|nr:tRNA (guanosine(46)-N7)-methyltransferase TrmB [Caulobacter sp.]
MLHGRRAGRPLRVEQRARMARDLPALRVDLADLGAPAALFPAPVSGLRLEVGFGGGEHLAHEAGRFPAVGFIGCEPFLNGVAKLVERIEALRLGNVRLHAGDAGELLDALPPACLDGVDVFYPDPWPKRRQRKRRFLSAGNLGRLARVLKPGAPLRFATDIDDYAGWVLARVLGGSDFAWAAREADDWRRPWDGWPSTRYEAKAIREGRPPAYLTFVRR